MKTLMLLLGCAGCVMDATTPPTCIDSNAEMLDNNQACIIRNGFEVDKAQVEVVFGIAAEEFQRHYNTPSLINRPIEIRFNAEVKIGDKSVYGATWAYDNTIDLVWKDLVVSTALAHELLHAFANNSNINSGHDNQELFLDLSTQNSYQAFINAENVSNTRACDIYTPDKWISVPGGMRFEKHCYWYVVFAWQCEGDKSCPDGWIDGLTNGTINYYGYSR